MQFAWGLRTEYPCSKCGVSTFSWCRFTQCEGEPVICEPCIAEALGLGRLSSKPEVVEWEAKVRAEQSEPSFWQRLRGR